MFGTSRRPDGVTGMLMMPLPLPRQGNYDKLMAGYKETDNMVTKTGHPTEHFKQNWLLPQRSFPDAEAEVCCARLPQ